MKISLVQMNSWNDIKSNFHKAINFAQDSLTKPDIICFSERFLYRGNGDLGKISNEESEYLKKFKAFAEKNEVNIILWSVDFGTKDEEKVTNTSFVINREGKIIHRYDKIYMFNVYKNDLVIKESDSTIAGKSLGLFELEGIKMGVGICYDIRYPEYFQELTKRWAKVIFLPANFRKSTWNMARDILTKARAIENQAFFCACGQTWWTWVAERCWNTRIIKYDGTIIKDINKAEGVITANINLWEQTIFKKEFPVLKQIKNFTNHN